MSVWSSLRAAAAARTHLGTFDKLLDFTPARLSFYLWLCCYATWGIFHSPRSSGITQDWQFFEMLDEVSRKTVLDYHQFPLWNPYWCGGITHIGNPQTTFLTPTFPLVLLFGSTLGLRVSILLVLIVACEGGYRLFRQLGMGASATLLGSIAYPLFGRSLGWLHDGQVGLHGITMATWVAYGWLRGINYHGGGSHQIPDGQSGAQARWQLRYLVLAAAFLAWILAFRGIQPGPQLALAFGLWAVLLGRRRFLDLPAGSSVRARLVAAVRPFAALAVVGALAAGFIAIRMLPVLATVLAHPRTVVDNASNNLTQAWVEILFMPNGTPGYGASGYAFIGRATYLLFLGALLFAAPRRRAAAPLLIGVLFMFITLGQHGEYSIYYQLHRMPLYRNLRNPALYAFTGAFFLVIAGSTTLDELDRWLRARASRLLQRSAALLPLVGLGTAWHLAVLLHGAMELPVYAGEVTPRVAQEFKQARGNHFVAPVWAQLDRGSLDCYDETPWPGSPLLRADAPAEEYLADAAAGTVKRLSWSPQRIELAVELSRPAQLLVNQNWASGWRSSVGKVRSEKGLLAVDLPAGSHTVVLTMLPPLALAGLALMLCTVAAAVWMVRRDRRRQAGLTGAA